MTCDDNQTKFLSCDTIIYMYSKLYLLKFRIPSISFTYSISFTQVILNGIQDLFHHSLSLLYTDLHLFVTQNFVSYNFQSNFPRI